MSANKYSQLHRRLLFHWTGPRYEPTPDKVVPLPLRDRSDREEYLNVLESILENGLWFSKPGGQNTEWIVEDEISATHPMLCFSEWGVADSNAHSGRYGLMGLGFTRKFVMGVGGRPVVYVPNTRSDPFRKALIEMIGAARNSKASTEKLRRHADFLASHLKSYHFKRSRTKPTQDDQQTGKKERKPPGPRPDDDHLRLDFGGLFANLEDREWRILPSDAGSDPAPLSFTPGQLAIIVFPDHQTLSLAMQRDTIMKWTRHRDHPSVCLMSREMIMSM